MALGKINFKGVGERTVFPSGTYDALTYKYSVRHDDKKDCEVINASFKIDEEGDYDGKVAFQRWSLDPDMLWLFKRDMISMGVDPSAFEGENAENVDVEAMVQEFFNEADPMPVRITMEKTAFERNGETVPISNITKIEPR